MEPGTLSTVKSSASESTQAGNESSKKKSTSRERSGMTIHDVIVLAVSLLLLLSFLYYIDQKKVFLASESHCFNRDDGI